MPRRQQLPGGVPFDDARDSCVEIVDRCVEGVRGSVIDLAGDPVPSIRVTLLTATTERGVAARDFQSTATDSRGAFSFALKSGAEFGISVSPEATQPFEEFACFPVARAGANLTVRVGPGVTLGARVELLQGAPAMQLKLALDEHCSEFSRACKSYSIEFDRAFTLCGVSPGPYGVSVLHRWFERGRWSRWIESTVVPDVLAVVGGMRHLALRVQSMQRAGATPRHGRESGPYRPPIRIVFEDDGQKK